MRAKVIASIFVALLFTSLWIWWLISLGNILVEVSGTGPVFFLTSLFVYGFFLMVCIKLIQWICRY